MPTNQEITLLSVLVLVITYVKAWAFKRWKISQALQFFIDWLIYLSFIFLLTAVLYNMTRVSMKPNSANSPKVIAVHPLDARQ
ncbi:hypothetical protein [Pseudomonas sp. No.117]|jgi:predicted membrane protein